MNKISSKRSQILAVSIGLILLLILIVGGIYLNYAQSESREMVSDIPGTVISTKPVKETPTVSPTETPSQSSPTPATPTPAPAPVAQPPRNPTAVISGFEGRQASGNATIITTTEGTFIRLEDNFDSSRAAPDNRVYLGDANGRQIEIAKLKAPSGGQNFRIPDNINVRDYTYIWIHCKAYNTTYGSGQITF